MLKKKQYTYERVIYSKPNNLCVTQVEAIPAAVFA